MNLTMGRTIRWLHIFGLAVVAATVVTTANSAGAQDSRYPDVLAVKVRASGAGAFDFDVTISSPYDTPQRYADAFRAAAKDGRVFGERVLLHDHGDEQPFTRDLYGVTIPPEVRVIVIEARDQKWGYGGKVVEVALPGR